jgi:3,4-dihydroxy-2-butanone 4-phosphate synthase
VPVGTDGARIGARATTARSGPATIRHLYSDNIKTESFEIPGSIVPLQSQNRA